MLKRCPHLCRDLSRIGCTTYEGPQCSKQKLEQLPCPEGKQSLRNSPADTEKTSIWENPECCTNPCPDFLPRFDELYYKTNNEQRCTYQQTWVECPKMQIKPKKVCCFEQLAALPPLVKRSPKQKPQTACLQNGSKVCTINNKDRNCPKLYMSGCQSARTIPKCKRQRSPKHCQKECTPYPSFSECLKEATMSTHPVECKCLNLPMMCEVWSEMRRRMTFVK